MRQGHDDRALAEALADPVLEWARTKKALDRHLADRDQDLRREQSQLGVEPVRAVRDAGGRRPQVAGVALVAPGEASHQRRDVGHAAKLLGVAKPGAEHPAVELLAGPPGEGPSRLPLGGTGRLAHEKERRAPLALERGVGLGDDPLVGAHAARPARGLVLEKSVLGQITRARRGFGAAPGMRPRLVTGLPSISLMSAVKAIGGAELIAIPTP